jgi:hypothetical protein
MAIQRASIGTVGTLAVFIAVRFASEVAMISAHGPDAQIPIWWMFILVKLAFWLCTGYVICVLLAAWSDSWPRICAIALASVWATAILWASWQYARGAGALAAAANRSTQPAQLSALVHFSGIQAGYELDNRLAAHPNTPVNALRELSARGNVGTLMTLARNPNTPEDVLLRLTETGDEWVQKSLEQNPKLQPTREGER